jgi:hypothetical protein
MDSNALPSPDSWLTRESLAAPTVTGCHWCNGNGTEEDGPCDRQSCQDEAEDDYRLARIVAARKSAEECFKYRTRAFGLAGRYMLEGDSPHTLRVRDAMGEAVSWQRQAHEFLRTARALGVARIVHVEEVSCAAE